MLYTLYIFLTYFLDIGTVVKVNGGIVECFSLFYSCVEAFVFSLVHFPSPLAPATCS